MLSREPHADSIDPKTSPTPAMTTSGSAARVTRMRPLEDERDDDHDEPDHAVPTARPRRPARVTRRCPSATGPTPKIEGGADGEQGGPSRVVRRVGASRRAVGRWRLVDGVGDDVEVAGGDVRAPGLERREDDTGDDDRER